MRFAYSRSSLTFRPRAQGRGGDEVVRPQSRTAVQKFDIIIANLPYLTPQELKEKSIKKEPRVALLAG
ncbi:hypothetical protein K8R42_04350, partial [bacterium]|nr:hypothetical protein [bacterium]